MPSQNAGERGKGAGSFSRGTEFVFTEGRQNDLVRTLGRLFDFFCGLSVR